MRQVWLEKPWKIHCLLILLLRKSVFFIFCFRIRYDYLYVWTLDFLNSKKRWVSVHISECYIWHYFHEFLISRNIMACILLILFSSCFIVDLPFSPLIYFLIGDHQIYLWAFSSQIIGVWSINYNKHQVYKYVCVLSLIISKK